MEVRRVSLITLVIISVSITLVFTEGSLFNVFRRRGPKLLRDLASCPLCSGVWIGMICAGFAIDQGHLVLIEGAQTIGRVAPYVLGIGAITGISALTVKRVWDLLDAVSFALDAMTGSQPLEAPEPRNDGDPER